MKTTRRVFLKSLLATSAVGLLPVHAQLTKSSFNFQELQAGFDTTHHVAEGYEADVLIKWGDRVVLGAPDWFPEEQTGAGQAKQFGYNNDYLAYFPLRGSSHGLLCVNHEYTNEELMFHTLKEKQSGVNFKDMTKQMVDVERMAVGGSIIEIKLNANKKWEVVQPTLYARRITSETPMEMTGIAAGHESLKTKADPTGTKVLGMFGNCAGGKTPWGTWLSGEENVQSFFWLERGQDVPPALKSFNYSRPRAAWGKFYDRFNASKEPNEAYKFGWVVEIDPHKARSTPRKHTALGRMKHEGAMGITNKSNKHYVIYTGDDEVNQCIYRFITKDKVTGKRKQDMNLLHEGTLSVAHFKANGKVEWRDLVLGQHGLTPANGFNSQADILIETRRAAKIAGGTPMDRPEDIEVNPKTQKVYAVLSKNMSRKPEQVDAANPRGPNPSGHIIEMQPPNNDHTAPEFSWEILVKAGDPSKPEQGASFNKETTRNGWFANPDNVAIDALGRLWVGTDGHQPSRDKRTDGLYALETAGALRGTSKLFYRVPLGAECTGPEFTPNLETLFVSVQHPGEADDEDKDAKPATYENPTTRWPDFKSRTPPRPSVVAITRIGGGKIAL